MPIEGQATVISAGKSVFPPIPSESRIVTDRTHNASHSGVDVRYGLPLLYNFNILMIANHKFLVLVGSLRVYIPTDLIEGRYKR